MCLCFPLLIAAGSFDWEEEHERLAVGLEGETFSDVSCRENTKDYGNTERSFRSQEVKDSIEEKYF